VSQGGPCDPSTKNVLTPVVWSEREIALQTGNLRGLEQLVANVKVIGVPQATHCLNPVQPLLWNAFIKEFVERGENDPAVQEVLAANPPNTALLC
jgi:hypothetical protein